MKSDLRFCHFLWSEDYRFSASNLWLVRRW